MSVGTFARARDWRERAKVPLPLHPSDERSGFSRGSRDRRGAPGNLLASAEAIDAIAERYSLLVIRDTGASELRAPVREANRQIAVILAQIDVSHV